MKDCLPARKTIRLKGYDYSNEGMYFITICTKNRERILGTINGSVKTDPYMKINDIGKIVEKELKEIENHFKNIKIDEYVIMPNHLHFIIQKIDVGAGLDLPVNTSINTIIGLFKSGVSRSVKYSLWQRNYYEHVIRGEKDYYIIKEYIQNNVINWKKDKYF